MAITQADFNKIWASTSPLTPYEFSENNYKQGWNFVGATPPSRQMWDYLQKQNDEKAQWLYLNVVQGVPVGVVQAFAGSTTPQGWLLCDGSAVSRTDYADLFSVIGTTYGSGDGSTTFNVPNLTNKFIQGNGVSGVERSAGLPNITASATIRAWHVDNGGIMSDFVGAMYATSQSNAGGGVPNSGTNLKLNTIRIDASRSSSIYGNSTTVQPPAVTMRYIIKY